MPDYVASFGLEDQKRVFRFFALFSRWECALKRYFPKRGQYGEAQSDWEKFADEVAGGMAGINSPSYEEARAHLLNSPPHRQHFENNQVTWQPNPKRSDETDTRYLLRVVRDVRNNLFHGGKYQDGPVHELARDRRLIDAASAVLEACVDLDARIRIVFDEAPN